MVLAFIRSFGLVNIVQHSLVCRGHAPGLVLSKSRMAWNYPSSNYSRLINPLFSWGFLFDRLGLWLFSHFHGTKVPILELLGRNAILFPPGGHSIGPLAWNGHSVLLEFQDFPGPYSSMGASGICV